MFLIFPGIRIAKGIHLIFLKKFLLNKLRKNFTKKYTVARKLLFFANSIYLKNTGSNFFKPKRLSKVT